MGEMGACTEEKRHRMPQNPDRVLGSGTDVCVESRRLWERRLKGKNAEQGRGEANLSLGSRLKA